MGAGTGTGTGRPPRNAAQRRPPAASATGTGSSTSSTDTGSTGIGNIIGGSTGSGTGGSTGGTGTCRGTTCLEGGSFLLNFVGCAQCGRRDFVLVGNRAAGLHGGEEIVTYDHLCKNCHHLIARHEYTFSIVDDYQEYTMLCLLCGRAEDSVSILPDDPRQMTPLF